MELIGALTDRKVIVTLAVLGAIMAAAGSFFRVGRTNAIARFARMMMWTGYAISFASVLLFIVAGFASNR
jgi:hypothetical protein